MAVKALGCLGVTESRDLAVVGLEVALGDLVMAAAAGGHDAQLEAGLIRALDGMRGVTGAADGQFLAGLGGQLSLAVSIHPNKKL